MSHSTNYFTVKPDGILLLVRATPGASRNEITGVLGDGSRLRLKTQAPPEDGRANQALCEFLAKTFKLPKKSVTLLRGEKSREKDFLIECESLKKTEIVTYLNNIISLHTQ